MGESDRPRPNDANTLPAPPDGDTPLPPSIPVSRDVSRSLAETISPPPPVVEDQVQGSDTTPPVSGETSRRQAAKSA